MRALLAIAELRVRGAAAARLAWLVPAVFALGLAVAAWAPGTDARARAQAADATALSAAAAAAVLSVLVLAATAFAAEVRTTAAHALLAAPVRRGTLVAGGVLGHTAFGLVLALGLGAGATIGLDVGGLGTRARAPVRPMEPAEVLARGSDGFAVLGSASREVRARFVVPEGLGPDERLHVRFAPRRQIESTDDWSLGGVLLASAVPPGTPQEGALRVRYKAGVAFEADLPVTGLAPGAEGEIVLTFVESAWRLRFGEGSIEVGGAREYFASNLVQAVLCLVPLLALAACAGAAASARLGGAAATALVLFLVLVVAGRGVIVDGASFVVEAAAREEEEHGHEGHDHHVEVSPVQVGLARAALVGIRAVPDAASFWRFGDLASGRAVGSRDLGHATLAGVLPCLVLAAASWVLVRRRELLPE